MPSILIIDDERGIRDALADFFRLRGWDASGAESGEAGLQTADELVPDVIVLDIRLPGMSGMDVLKKLKGQGSPASVVILTAWGTIADAVEAIKLGAEQYLTKPVNLAELDALMNHILETRKLRIENLYYRQRMDHPLVGVSLEVQKLHHMIDLMAENTDTTVLLLGESGTGKELVAREIHRRSPRAERPFMDINCAALPEGLIESEMFGHERGAFTDARKLKRGLFEVADGGTVFLDEVGDLPLTVQPKLLRFLETHSVQRVGGNREIPLNVRIIAATNRDLAAAVQEGRFREDLYYRLKVFPVVIPPLRERPEDIPALTEFFLQQFNRTLNKGITGFTERVMDCMRRYPWPGNVRELRNIVERMVTLSKTAQIDVDLLPREVTGERPPLRRPSGRDRAAARKTLNEVEREHILDVLRLENNNRSRTAAVLGISRSTLIEKLKKYGIS